jgi:hypothetical protein
MKTTCDLRGTVNTAAVDAEVKVPDELQHA